MGTRSFVGVVPASDDLVTVHASGLSSRVARRVLRLSLVRYKAISIPKMRGKSVEELGRLIQHYRDVAPGAA